MDAPLNCMFDTNIFNRLLDGAVPLEAMNGRVVAHATHIQHDEIRNTKEIGRRRALERVFEGVVTVPVPTDSFVLDVSRLDEGRTGGNRVVPTSSAVWDVSRWDQASWSGDDNLYSTLKAELDALNRAKKNNVHDALIAETSIKNGYVLVTEDGDLATVARKFKGECLSLLELWQRIQ